MPLNAEKTQKNNATNSGHSVATVGGGKSRVDYKTLIPQMLARNAVIFLNSFSDMSG
jgi:hypothetical protein